MIAVYLRHHATSRKDKGNIRILITEEQWEHVNQWAKPREDEFEAPANLWPFIDLKAREALDLGEFEPTPFLGKALWRPTSPSLVTGDIPEINLSTLPIEVWHPDVPQSWPFPQPSVLETP